MTTSDMPLTRSQKKALAQVFFGRQTRAHRKSIAALLRRGLLGYRVLKEDIFLLFGATSYQYGRAWDYCLTDAGRERLDLEIHTGKVKVTRSKDNRRVYVRVQENA